MGSERAAEYYDEHISNFLVDYEASIWKPVYDAAVSLMPADKSLRVIDIGCGTGRLAEALRRSGYVNYTGFDFSKARVAEARRYLPDHDFRVLDVFSEEAAALIAAADVTTITEVLEHIERDMDVLASIPAGTRIVLSVPDFDSPTHVRKFKDMDAVLARFSGLIDIDEPSAITVLKSNNKNKTFVCRARRR